jgi:hypothetical protein
MRQVNALPSGLLAVTIDVIVKHLNFHQANRNLFPPPTGKWFLPPRQQVPPKTPREVPPVNSPRRTQGARPTRPPADLAGGAVFVRCIA